jgi:hypothetical protein
VNGQSIPIFDEIIHHARFIEEEEKVDNRSIEIEEQFSQYRKQQE